MTKENYNPFSTAITRDYLSRPTRELVNRNLLYGDILDVGCGKGADMDWLQKDHKLNVWGYDKYNEKFNKPYLLEQKYDCIICNYVFNVIPSLTDHNILLQQLKSLSQNIYISVRSDIKAIKDNWEWSDREQGYWTPKFTFQRFYTKDNGMVEKLFGEVEYLVDDSSMRLFKIKLNKESG